MIIKIACIFMSVSSSISLVSCLVAFFERISDCCYGVFKLRERVLYCYKLNYLIKPQNIR